MNIKAQIKRYGCLKTTCDIFIRLLEKTIGGYVFCCLALPADIINSRVISVDSFRYTVGFLELDQLLRLIKPEEMTMTYSFAELAYAKGDRCFGIIDGENLVHYNWCATSPTNVVGNLQVQFPENMVYAYNLFTDPRYRGRNLQPFATTLALKNYVSLGYVGSITIVSINNFSSLAAVRKTGFSIIGHFFVISSGKSYCYHSKGCMHNGVKLVRA
jgi:hypothetical protein